MNREENVPPIGPGGQEILEKPWHGHKLVDLGRKGMRLQGVGEPGRAMARADPRWLSTLQNQLACLHILVGVPHLYRVRG